MFRRVGAHHGLAPAFSESLVSRDRLRRETEGSGSHRAETHGVLSAGLSVKGSRAAGWQRTALSLLCVALLAGLAAPALRAEGDALAASRRLREVAHSLKPLSDSTPGLARDEGAIAILEHDGSNYDMDLAGTPNYAPRAQVAQRFYQTHGDLYDFLVVFTNFEFDTTLEGDSAIAFYNLVRNDVQGIHKPIVDNGYFFHSPSRLRGYVDMAAIARYTSAPLSARGGIPLSTNPVDAGFRDTLGVLAHEIGHQWLARVRFREAAGSLSEGLLGAH